MSRLRNPQRRNPGEAPQSEVERARKLYKSFHEADALKINKLRVPELAPVWVLWGTLESLSYKPHKPSKRSNIVYEHEMGDYGSPFKFGKEKPLLLVSADGQQMLIVKGRSRFHVNERGILG